MHVLSDQFRVRMLLHLGMQSILSHQAASQQPSNDMDCNCQPLLRASCMITTCTPANKSPASVAHADLQTEQKAVCRSKHINSQQSMSLDDRYM